jgi:hypothetical protein
MPQSSASSPQRRTTHFSLIIVKLLQSAHHAKLGILVMFQDTRAQRRRMRHTWATLEDGIILGARFEKLIAGSDDALVAPRLEPFVFIVDFLAWG